MPIDSQHPHYTAMLPAWTLIRDVLSGERAVKDKGTTYLPALVEQDPTAYARYRSRAQFVEVTQQAHEEFVGYLFRKDPVLKFPGELNDFIDDATMNGVAFYDWLKDATREVCAVGRGGTLIDYDDALQRPFLSFYHAEQIINWKMHKIGGQQVLALLVLKERSATVYSGAEGASQAPDEFEHRLFDQWRVLKLDEISPEEYRLSVGLWRRREASAVPSSTGALEQATLPGTGPAGLVTIPTDDRFIQVDKVRYPQRSTGALDRIPFVFHGPNNFLPAIDRAPMESIALVNLSHYRTSADLENGLHFLGLPQPYAKGFGENADKLPIGTNTVWASDKDWAATGYLQVTGGFDSLEKALERKEQTMAKQGAKLFDSAAKGRSPEAYDTLRLRQTGETVTLSNIAIAQSQSASMVLRWAAYWMNPASKNVSDFMDSCSAQMNTDFVENDVPSDKLTALGSALVQGAISRKTYFYNLKQGEMYPDDWDYDDEEAAIQNDMANALPVGATGAQGAQFGGGAPAGQPASGQVPPAAKPPVKRAPPNVQPAAGAPPYNQ